MDLDRLRLALGASGQELERTVEATADTRLRRITHSLSHFAPQLALPKRFDTTRAVDVTGVSATPVALWIDRVLEAIAARRGGSRGDLILAPSA